MFFFFKLLRSRSDQGSIFTNVLRKAFMHADLKNSKQTDFLKVFFVLFESAHVKAAYKMLVKSTPRVPDAF